MIFVIEDSAYTFNQIKQLFYLDVNVGFRQPYFFVKEILGGTKVTSGKLFLISTYTVTGEANNYKKLCNRKN